MSQINTENLLKIGNTPSLASPEAPPVQFRDSSFVGGNVQLGRPQQQIGRSSEEASYQALAQIAGGVGAGLDIFSQIASNVDKGVIENATLSWQETNQNENLTPDQKISELDKILSNNNTPFTGDNWKRKLRLEADKNWTSKEARDQFEEKRYNEEKAKWLNLPDNRGRNFDDAAIRKEFDAFYARKFPTAVSNTWFQLTEASNLGTFNQLNTNLQVQLLDRALLANFQIPTPEILDNYFNGITSGVDSSGNVFNVEDKYIGFFELYKAAGTKNYEDFKDYVWGKLNDKIKPSLEGMKQELGTDPGVVADRMRLLQQRLPEITLNLAEATMEVVTKQKQKEIERSAVIAIDYARTQLRDPSKAATSNEAFWQTVLDFSGALTKTPEERKNYIREVLPEQVAIFDQMISENPNSPLLAVYPNWNTLSAYEKANIVITEFEQWATSPTNKDKFKSLFGPPDAFIYELRNAVYNSKGVQERFQRELEGLENVTRNTISVIKSSATQEEVNVYTTEALTNFAKQWGIDVKTLEGMYIVNNTRNVTRTAQEWWVSLTEKERQELQTKGFTINLEKNFNATRTLLVALDAANQERTADIKNGLVDTKEVDKVNEDLNKISPFSDELGREYGSIRQLLINGAFNDAHPAKAGLSKIREAKEQLDIIRDSAPGSRERTLAEQSLTLIRQQHPGIEQYALTLQREEEYFVSTAVKAAEQFSPTNTTYTDEQQKELRKKAETQARKVFANVMKGTLRVENVLPSNPIDATGAWTDEGLGYILTAVSLAEFANTSRDVKNVFKPLEELQQSLVNKIGNITQTNQLDDPENVLAIVTTALVAQRFDPNRYPAEAQFWKNRAVFLSGWAEGKTVAELKENLFSSATSGNIRAALTPLLELAKIHVGQRNPNQTVVNIGKFEVPLKNLNAKVMLSALGSQIIETDQDIITGFGTPQNPMDPDWDADNFVQAFNDTAKSNYSPADFAAIFRRDLNLDAVLNNFTGQKLSDEEVIRYGAQFLSAFAETNPDALVIGTEVFYNTNWTDVYKGFNSDSDPKLSYWLQMLNLSLDLDINKFAIGEAASYPTGNNPLNEFYIVRGIDSNGNFLFVNQMAVQTGKAGDSFSPAAAVAATKSNVDTRKGWEALETIYPPKREEVTGKTNVDNGTMYRTGVGLLTSTNTSEKALRVMLSPWIEKNRSIGIVNIPAVVAVENAFAILRKAEANSKVPLSTQRKLEILNQAYIANGGEYPFINGQNYQSGVQQTDQNNNITKASQPGFATLSQDTSRGISNLKSPLPTYSWINRDLNGTPYLIVPNTVLLESNIDFNETAIKYIPAPPPPPKYYPGSGRSY